MSSTALAAAETHVASWAGLGRPGLIDYTFCLRRTMANLERTFIAIKPDGVQRGLVGEIIKRFEQKGFHLVAMKFLRVTTPFAPYPSAAGLRESGSPASSLSTSPFGVGVRPPG